MPIRVLTVMDTSIVGSPQATIVNTDVDDPIGPFKLANAITLAGAGSGRVTLSSVRTTGSADGSFYSISGAGIFGGGFSELHLTDCSIQPAQWTALTGQAQGANALTVFLPYVLLERCTVVGGLSDTDACDYPWNPSGGAGVAAPGATVAVLDSTVTGGRGPIMCFSDGNCPGGPLMESDGGPGIVAATVLRAASTISGGKGQPVTCGSTIVGTELDGPAIVAGTITDLGTALTAVMFVTARRNNGWAGLHDRQSGTRVVSRMAARSSATKPIPLKPASAIAATRSSIGTGLVWGCRIGDVSPALVHAVATSWGVVTGAP